MKRTKRGPSERDITRACAQLKRELESPTMARAMSVLPKNTAIEDAPPCDAQDHRTFDEFMACPFCQRGVETWPAGA